MSRSSLSATIVKCAFLAACVGWVSDSAACLRRYSAAEKAEMREAATKTEPLHYVMELESEKSEAPSDTALEELRLAADKGDYRAKSDYAVALIFHGDVSQAVEILKAVEVEHPGEYVVAANLGTAFELAGDDEHALQWITTGLHRNPESHQGSEWLHVKILEAKLATAKDPAWLDSHSILGIDFGRAARPTSPAQTVTDLDGHAKTLAEVRSALEYQLRERMSLVESPDPVVANLLLDLGNLWMLNHKPDFAYRVYQVADRYAGGTAPVIHQRLMASRAAHWPSLAEIATELLLGCLGLGLVTAIGLYLRQVLGRSAPAAAA